ncbi:hypothetical protein F4819DRAFT_150248 [Hypoxylon fuscum]|nr:hypothetical protein F4819DRAFT_150248 [Hypoxylon fuscum]
MDETKLPFDILVGISKYLPPRGQLHLALTRRDLYPVISRARFQLREVLFNVHNGRRACKPVEHGMVTGNMKLLHMIDDLIKATDPSDFPPMCPSLRGLGLRNRNVRDWDWFFSGIYLDRCIEAFSRHGLPLWEFLRDRGVDYVRLTMGIRFMEDEGQLHRFLYPLDTK